MLRSFNSICLAMFLIFMVYRTVSYGNYSNSYDGFGYEYGNIAESLYMDNGFSNPFPELTQRGIRVSTAWNPVLYTLYYWLIFQIAGLKTMTAFWVLLSMRGLMFVLTFWLILKLRPSNKIYSLTSLIIFTFYSHLVSFESVFDFSLNSLLSIASIYIIYKYFSNTAQSKHQITLLFLAVLIPGSSISISIVFFIFLVYFLYRSRSRNERILFISSICLVILTFGLWGSRNQVQLGKFIPFKSNLWFEFYLSNVESESGLLKRSYFRKFHPYANEEVRDRYISMGEVNFLKEFEAKSKRYLFENSGDYLRKIFNRAFNSLVFSVNFDDRAFLPDSLSLAHRHFLEKNRLSVAGMWHVVDISEDNIRQFVLSHDIENNQDLLNQILEVRNEVQSNMYYECEGMTLQIGILMLCLVPSIIIIIIFLNKRLRTDKVFIVTFLFYLVSIGIYIGVSHYERYQYFHVVYFTVFIALFTDHISRYSIVKQLKSQLSSLLK